MFISFVVPVYNVEDYIRECIDGLLTLRLDYEIILVVGKSSDSSDDICSEYAHQNRRVSVVKQEGKGLSDARNCGLKIAKGEYVSFVDSDDYLMPKLLNALLQQIKVMPEVEVFVSDFIRVFVNGKLVESTQIESTALPITDSDYLARFLGKPGCFWNVWRYVYKRSFLIDNQLWFKQEVFSEDVDYTVRTLLTQPQMAFYHNPYYYYRVCRPNSLMNINTLQRIVDTVTIISDCAVLAAESSFSYRQKIVEHMVFEWVVNLANILELPTEHQKDAVNVFLARKEVLKLSRKFEYRLIGLWSAVFGLKLTAVMMQTAKRIRRTIKILFDGRT